MNGATIVLLIILGIIIVALIYAWIRPYTIKYDTTLHITGGLGTGKTKNAVEIARNLWHRVWIRWKIHDWYIGLINKHRKKVNPKKIEYNKTHKKQKKIKEIIEQEEEPRLYSNIPILLKKRRKGNIYSTKLTKEMLLLKERINQHSVVVIDELPQLVNQFNWNIEEVKNNLNEFITFFRHYVGGYWISTSQAIDDVVKQIRTKLNQYYWLFDFHKFLFIFYKVRITNMMASDLVTNVSTNFIETNTRWKYGCFLPKRYETRCYKHRYDQVETTHNVAWKKLFTKKVIRFSNYESPLDDKKDKTWHKE